MSICYGLAFSGGDLTSAYQAGALQALAAGLEADKVAYQAISGAGGGAVNAAILAEYDMGQEGDAASRMVTFWDNAANATLGQDWVGGIATGLLVKGALYDDSDVLDFLKTELPDIHAVKRWTNISATDMTKGTQINEDLETFGAADGTPDIYDYLFAEFAQAGIYKPVKMNDDQFYNGATVYDLDAFSVVNRCREQGFAMTDITVDVIMTAERSVEYEDTTGFDTIQNALRAGKILASYASMGSYLRAVHAYPAVNFRYLIAPSSKIRSNFNSLTLTQAEVDEMIALGVTDAEAAIAGGMEHADDMRAYFKARVMHDRRLTKPTFEEYLRVKSESLATPEMFLQ